MTGQGVISPTLRKFLAPTTSTVVGVALAFALFAYVKGDVMRDAELRFERQAADAKHIIEKRLRSYVSVTYGLRALFAAKDLPSRIEFHRYIDALKVEENFPGFVQLNFARAIKGEEKQSLEDEVRRDASLNGRGYPTFSIRPPDERPSHEVLIYIEPMEGNEFAFGLDIGAMNARAQARARDDGELVSSGRLRNVGKDQFVGLAMRLAVYRQGMPLDTVDQRRAAFRGTVGAGYNVRKLMAGVLDETTMTAMRYRLYDAGPAGASTRKGPMHLLFDSAQASSGVPDDNYALPGPTYLNTVLPLELAGRSWQLYFSAPQSAYISAIDAALPWLVLAAGLLMSALLFAVLYSFASSRARAVAIAEDMTRELRESEAQIRDLLRRLVSVQEAERRRFSADLHDLVGQSLSVLGMGFETIRALLPGALPKKAEATIDHMGKLLKETMGSVRTVMSNLRPPLLDDYGLHAAIEWHAAQLQARTGLRVAVESKDIGPRPTAEVELALFRIVQEALTNVAKHAAASNARVALARMPGRLTLIVEDNGRGIAPLAANDPGPAGWGMAVMRERAAAVGGAVRVVSSTSGTRVIVEVATGDPAHPS